MAEIIIPEGYGSATLFVTMTGKSNPMTTTIGYSFGGVVPPDDAAQAVFEAATADGSILGNNLMLDSFVAQGCRVYQRDGGLLLGGEYFSPVPGAAIGATPPVNASLLATKSTGIVGRKYRGRMYVPNALFKETDIDQMGNISSPQFAFWVTACNTFLDEMNDGALGGAYLLHSDLTAPNAITSFIPRQKMATQRRRLRS